MVIEEEKGTDVLTQEIVDQNLNTAVDEQDYKEILDWPVDDICGDLIAYSPDVDFATVEELRPFVQSWLDRRKA